MTWISTLLPWQWAVLSTVPLGILLLYFLKLRREPVNVPSTFLWAKTIEDLHVNSLMQRLKRSLLLFLQLAAVALAAIALLRPGIRGESSSVPRTVFLLDTSASMRATDVEGAESRFEFARKRIEERIEQMDDDESAMLVTFSDRPDTVQSFTSDRRRLREALGSVEVSNQPTDILGALKAADGLANPRRSSEVGDVNDVQVADAMPADLLIFSDGGFQPVTEFNLGNLVPTYVAVGSQQASNVAITAFSAERNLERPGEVQAFATIVNSSAEDIECTATLSINDEFLDASAVQVEAGQQTGLSFELESDEAVRLKLSLDIDDDLAIDNTAFAGLSPLRNVNVLVVTTGNRPLEVGLGTSSASKICTADFVDPEYLQTDQYRERAASGSDDLIIYDRCSPSEMPMTNTFFIGSLPVGDDTTMQSDAPSPDASGVEPPNRSTDPQLDSEQASEGTSNQWNWSGEKSGIALIDIDRTHPMMRYIELFSLLIFSGRPVDGPDGSIELVGADVGSVLVLNPRDGFQDLVLGFEIITTNEDGTTATNTNWYAERSWPVFVLNVLRYLAGAAEASGAPSYRPGDTVRVRLENAVGDVSLVRGQDSEPMSMNPTGVAEIVDTEQLGNYQVKADGRLADLFAINLFDQSESNLKVAKSVELGYEEVTATAGSVEQRKEYWRLLLVAMLGMLATEWWVYARRVG